MDSSFDVSGDQVVRVFNVVFTRLILGHGDSVISLTIAFCLRINSVAYRDRLTSAMSLLPILYILFTQAPPYLSPHAYT
jgi:hypothetical protein